MPLPTTPFAPHGKNENARPVTIPFNQPSVVGRELFYISQAVHKKHLAGDGHFTRRCTDWMEHHFHAQKILLTTSCTAALEIAAILANIQMGDEVILPSFTFAATANAFMRRGATLKFIDIRPDTLNMDERLIEKSITERTKAIVPVHYGGTACAMDTIMSIADKFNLLVIEDAAQGINAHFNGKALGTMGHLGAYSFHETKNISSGEGGALLINDPAFLERAEIVRDQGTTRAKFFRGELEEYNWVDEGSSAIPSEITAAFLYGQLEQTAAITRKRLQIFNYYLKQLAPLQEKNLLTLPTCPQTSTHNGHLFYILTCDNDQRNNLLQHLQANNIQATFHYIPLHNSPKGKSMTNSVNNLPVTEDISARLIRLPLYYELGKDSQDRVLTEIFSYFARQ